MGFEGEAKGRRKGFLRQPPSGGGGNGRQIAFGKQI